MIKEKLLIEAYRNACNYGEDVLLTKDDIAFHRKLIEEYQALDMIDQFNNTPATYFSYDKPVKKAKEIALDAAIKYIDRAPTVITFHQDEKKEPAGTRLVEMAKTIYQWLTEP